MPQLIDDLSGRIELGLFFQLRPFPLVPNEWDEFPYAIFNNIKSSSYIFCEVVCRRADALQSGRCKCHPYLEDVSLLRSLSVDVMGADGDGMVVGGLDGEFIVAPRLVSALQSGRFRGTRFLPVEISSNCSSMRSTPWQVMCFDGAEMYRPEIVLPTESNHCKKCGFSPIVCPGCGSFDTFCPQCGTQLVQPLSLAEDTQHVSDLVIRIPYGENGPVVTLDRWDGSDFLKQGIVTGRVVDTLFALNPAVLCAQALRCHVGDRNPREYEFLRSHRFIAQ